VSAPCRSIGRAIEAAAAGDTVEVGPGLYGDVDGDGAFTSSGDERPSTTGCRNLLRITKSVTVISRAGASQTIIAPRWPNEQLTFCSIVSIESSTVTFGTKDHGFTLTSSNGNDVLQASFHTGAMAVLVTAAAAEAAIGGNFLVFNSVGARIEGPDAVVTDNLFQSNYNGLGVYGPRATITGNAIEDSQIGIYATGAEADVSGNMICANRLFGVLLASGGGHRVAGNNVLGNGIGVEIDDIAVGTINGNNIFGNADTLLGNGGLVSRAAADIDSSNNYWGGPGIGSDPQDADYSLGSGTVDSLPNSPVPFAIAIAPLK